MNVRVLMVSILLLLTSSCVTTVQKIPKTKLPKSLRTHFGTCALKDGGGFLHYQSEKTDVSDLKLDWVNRDDGFIAEVSGPFGAQVARVEKKQGDKEIKLTGKAQTELPRIEVAQSGFLVVDGHEIGLKFSELLCFLHGKFSLKWLSFYTGSLEAVSSSKKVRFEDGKRSVVVARNESRHWCADVKWSYFLGLYGQNIEICNFRRAEKKFSTLERSNSFQLRLELE